MSARIAAPRSSSPGVRQLLDPHHLQQQQLLISSSFPLAVSQLARWSSLLATPPLSCSGGQVSAILLCSEYFFVYSLCSYHLVGFSTICDIW